MLTNEQINTLFVFCEKHSIRYYDVQVELVDHLANAIEEKMEANKMLSFETALESVYADFGTMGFATIISSRSKNLYRQYRNTRWKLFLSYFQWPKAAMTACLLAAFLFIGKIFSGQILYYLVFVIFIFVVVFDMHVTVKANGVIKKQRKKLMLTEISFERSWLIFSIGGFLSGIFRIEDLFDKNPVLLYSGYVAFVVIAVLFFFSTISYRQVIKTTEEMARKQYPEAFGITI